MEVEHYVSRWELQNILTSFASKVDERTNLVVKFLSLVNFMALSVNSNFECLLHYISSDEFENDLPPLDIIEPISPDLVSSSTLKDQIPILLKESFMSSPRKKKKATPTWTKRPGGKKSISPRNRQPSKLSREAEWSPASARDITAKTYREHELRPKPSSGSHFKESKSSSSLIPRMEAKKRVTRDMKTPSFGNHQNFEEQLVISQTKWAKPENDYFDRSSSKYNEFMNQVIRSQGSNKGKLIVNDLSFNS